MDEHVMRALEQVIEGRVGGLHPLAIPQAARLGLMVIAAAVCCSCSSSPQDGGVPGGDTKNNHPPTVRLVTIVPNPLILAGPITAHVAADDPDGTEPSKRYQWIVNGVSVLGATEHELHTNHVKRGDTIALEVVASDGQLESAPYRTVPTDHRSLHRIKPAQRRPVQKVPVPFRVRTGCRQCTFAGPALESSIGCVVGITSQRIKVSGVSRGIGPRGGSGRAPIRQRPAGRRLTGSIAHTARVIHHHDDIRRRRVRHEGRHSRVIGVGYNGYGLTGAK